MPTCSGRPNFVGTARDSVFGSHTGYCVLIQLLHLPLGRPLLLSRFSFLPDYMSIRFRALFGGVGGRRTPSKRGQLKGLPRRFLNRR
eukprot:4599205-Amphidinium_carterae.1